MPAHQASKVGTPLQLVCSHRLVTSQLLVVQETLTQVGQLFLSPVAAAGAPLLIKQAREDMSSSELLFSPLPGQQHSQEAEAWQVEQLC